MSVIYPKTYSNITFQSKTNFSSEQFSTLVNFCFFKDRDLLRNPCNEGWIQNFILNGGSSQTSDAITLYNYYNNAGNQFSTNFFLHDDINQKHLIRDKSLFSEVYLPGKL